MALKDLQNNFINFLNDEKKADILKFVKKGKIRKEELFQIYRNNLFRNLENSLKITFPLIYQYLGQEQFSKLAEKYIVQNPSKSNNLDNYGQNFAQNQNEFLQDLSHFEYSCHLSYLAADAEAVNQEDLQKIPTEELFDLKFQLHPSCFLGQSYYNFFLKKSDQKRKRIINYLIYRHDNKVKTEKISKSEYIFLEDIKNGLSLFEIYNKYDINIGELLAKYVNKNVIITILK